MNRSSTTTNMSEHHSLLKVHDASIAYSNGHVAVRDISVELEHGEIGAIVGPSGCGKSTLLRGIAGFEPLQNGTITMNGATLSTQSSSIAPDKRNIGMVFQDYALFPHLSVSQNIAFGLRNWTTSEREDRVSRLLNVIGLSEFGDRDPYSLSGGEQQRIALARAIAPKPELLLMDEPFSSLDVEICHVLIPEVRQILMKENISSIVVTHDHDIAFAIADKIGVMEQGRVHQWDNPYQVYHNPVNRFIARFIGEGEFIQATVVNDQLLETEFGLHAIFNEQELNKGDVVEILLRPDDVLHDDSSELTGEVIQKFFRGSHYLYTVRVRNGNTFYCLADSHHNHRIGERIGLKLNIDHIVLFRKGQEDAIAQVDALPTSSKEKT